MPLPDDEADKPVAHASDASDASEASDAITEQLPKRSAAATRQRILDAAEREFAARGFAGARLREIAGAAGIQAALIHHYFTDKRGLYRAVLDRALLPSSTAGWSLLENQHDLEGLLGGLVEVLLRFYFANRGLLAILRHEALSGSHILEELTRERALPIVETVAGMIEERQAAGTIRADVTAEEILVAGMSLVAYPYIEEGLLRVILPAANTPQATSLDRRKEVVMSLLLSAIRPTTPV